MITPRQEALLAKIVEVLRENEEPAPASVIARLTGVPKPAVEDLLDKGLSRSIVSFGESGYGLHDWAMAVYGGAQVTFDDQPFGPRDLRQELGIGRRVVMDLLDYWQREGLAARQEEGFLLTPRRPE